MAASQTRLPPILAPMLSLVPSGLQETVSTELPAPRTSWVWPVAASQTRTVSSCEPVATRLESGLQARAQAHWLWPRRLSSSSPVAASQMWAVVPEMSSVMMRLPSGLQETTLTQRRSRPWRLRTSSPVAASQTRGSAESKAVMMRRESGLHDRPVIGSIGPTWVGLPSGPMVAPRPTKAMGPTRSSSVPVVTSQTRAVPSSEAVATRVPSGLHDTAVRCSVCPDRVRTT